MALLQNIIEMDGLDEIKEHLLFWHSRLHKVVRMGKIVKYVDGTTEIYFDSVKINHDGVFLCRKVCYELVIVGKLNLRRFKNCVVNTDDWLNSVI